MKDAQPQASTTSCGAPVATSGTVVMDVDEFQPTEAEFTDAELHTLHDLDFSKRAADGEEIGL